MAQVFQCDACNGVASKGGNVQVAGESQPKGEMKELCIGCFTEVMAVLSPEPRKRRGRPAAAAETDA